MRIQTLRPDEKLSLQNDGKLEIFPIGTGSAFAKSHFQTNFILIKGNTHIMIDFGATAPRALLETARLKVTDLGVFFISHSHADHVGGMEEASLLNRYVGRPIMKQDKLKMIVSEGYQEILWDRSLRGGMEWNELKAGQRLTFTDYFEPIRPRWLKQQPRETFVVEHGGIKLELFRTKHVPDSVPDWESSFPSFGMFVDDRLFLSLDTRFDLELIHEYAPRAEVMFHDVQFFPGGVHASLEELRTLTAPVKAKMHPVHYPDNWDKQDITGFAGWVKQGVRYILD